MPLGLCGVQWNDAPMLTGIALGSNLGDRLTSLRAGRDFLLSLHEGSSPAAVSRIYETSPVGCPPGSPAFLNAVVEIETPRQPHDLLIVLQDFEQQLGRPRAHGKNSPRVLDLDILYCDDLVISAGAVTVPHPRLHMRRFVLQPLADIRPHLIPPGQTRTVGDLLSSLPVKPGVRLFATEW